MDFGIVSLDTIAKLQNKLKKLPAPVILNEKNNSEADLEMLKTLLKDQLFESEQIQYCKRQLKERGRKRSDKNKDLEVMSEKSGIADTSGVQAYFHDDSKLFDEEFGATQEEMEVEQRVLEQDLTDIFMDLGPATRELAPLKLKRPQRIKTKTIIKFIAPIVDPVVEIGDEDLEKDPHLFDYHMFHHISGISNLRKIMDPKLESLNITVSSGEDSIVKEDSYDNSLVYGSKP